MQEMNPHLMATIEKIIVERGIIVGSSADSLIFEIKDFYYMAKTKRPWWDLLNHFQEITIYKLKKEDFAEFLKTGIEKQCEKV